MGLPHPAADEQTGGRDIIVIGGSAGLAEAALELLAQLPRTLPASILIAYHIPPHAEGVLDRMLRSSVTLEVKLADDGEPIRRGVVYVAHPDRHLLLEQGHVRVTRGPRENRWRPAIDTLFRSAAVAGGSRVIGVLLTGLLDDGTAGLSAIKRCGGITVVQEPRDAAFPEMPQSALDNLPIDYRARLRDMPALLQRLVSEARGASPAVPREIEAESRVAAEGVPVSARHNVRFSCPDCGGPLQSVSQGGENERYRCMVGHAWNADALLSTTEESLEATLWAAIRLFRQRSHLLGSHAERELEQGRTRTAAHYREQMQESLDHAQRLQALVMGSMDSASGQNDDAEARGGEHGAQRRAKTTSA